MSETTKRCPRCGAALPEAAAFCPYCTADLRRRTAAVPPPVLPGWVLRSLAAALLILTAAAAVAGPGHRQLIGGAVQGVVYLAGGAAVVYLGHIGAAGIEDPDACGGQHRRAQQAQQEAPAHGRGDMGAFTAAEIPGTVGTEGGVFRQGRAAVGTGAVQWRSVLS